MTESESRLLVVGDNVCITRLPLGESHTGCVLQVNRYTVVMEWDDGQTGSVDHRDMGAIDFHGDAAELALRALRRTH